MPRGNPEDGVEGKVLRNLYSEGMILEADRIDHLTVGPLRVDFLSLSFLICKVGLIIPSSLSEY